MAATLWCGPPSDLYGWYMAARGPQRRGPSHPVKHPRRKPQANAPTTLSRRQLARKHVEETHSCSHCSMRVITSQPVRAQETCTKRGSDNGARIGTAHTATDLSADCVPSQRRLLVRQTPLDHLPPYPLASWHTCQHNGGLGTSIQQCHGNQRDPQSH